MNRYAFATTEQYSGVYKKLKEEGFEITVPIFSHSGFPEITIDADYSTFTTAFKEVTGIEYKDIFSTDDESNEAKK